MRKMIEETKIIKKPKLFYEEELLNASSVNVDLPVGFYLIEIHQAHSMNSALLHVSEESMCISTSTMFNATVSGAALGYYSYDTLGQILEIYDASESNITTGGHIDIYKF